MATLLDLLFFRFPVVLVAEIALTVYLSRKGGKRRLLWVIGSYLFFVAAALAFGLIVRDDFGFSFIPLILTTASWQALGVHLPQSVLKGDLVEMAFGLVLNCALFYAIDRLGYSRNSGALSDPQAT